MTTKLERIAKMEAELAALKADVQAEQKKTPCFTPKKCEEHWRLVSASDGRHLESSYHDECPPKAAFRDQATANAYAEAFNVMLELRRYADGGVWHFRCDERGVGVYIADEKYHTGHAFSGCYSSGKQAELAVKSVGEERIIAAIKTLCGAV